MADSYQVGNRIIKASELMDLLGRYQLLPQLVRGMIIDDVIAEYPLNDEERSNFVQQFYEQNKLSTPEARQAWLESQGMDEAQLSALIERPARLEKFKQGVFGKKVEAYFLTRKAALDRVLYSLIRTKDLGIAQELYFRIKEGEQSFADLAKQFSQGGEAATGGLVGPSPLTAPHPAIARTLQVSQPGQLWPPVRLEDWYVIVRLEKFFPAQLDESTRRQLIEEMFETWMREQLKAMGPLKAHLLTAS
ncbi:MAG: peptidylprolyl isomerase [Cyanobacteria bacterium M5B4]|nr:MAG: peptidylprolyl isomerase [Cyanobacteria bacterium M5B4]